MTTALGTYATPTTVKARIGSDMTWASGDTALLSTLCDQINAWIEGVVGRPLCPLPDTELLLDGIMAEDPYGRFSASLAQTGLPAYIGPAAGGLVLPVIFGVNDIASTSGELALEIAPYTGAAFVTVPRSDWFLRPSPVYRNAGWPATIIRLTDVPSSSNASGNRFPPGYENVRLTGPVGCFGWPAIPDDIAELAVTAVVRAWSARQAGQTDVIGSDEFGKPIVSRYVSGRDRDTLARYAVKPRTSGSDRTVWGVS